MTAEEDGYPTHEESSLLSPHDDYAPRVEYGGAGVTHPTSRSQSRERTTIASVSPLSQAKEQTNVWRILKDPIVRGVLLSYALLSLISTSNDIIFALWMHISVDQGGIGLTVRASCSFVFDLVFI